MTLIDLGPRAPYPITMMTTLRMKLIFALLFLSTMPRIWCDEPVPFLIGGYTDGVYASRLHPESGQMDEPRLIAKVHAPAFLCLHPHQDIFYCVSETGRDNKQHPPLLSAFRFRATDLESELLGSQPVPGDAPCYVSTDETGRFVFVANYSSGNIVVFPTTETGVPLEPSDVVQHPQGRGPNAQRQEGPHAHSILMDSTNTWVCVADLGLDQVRVYSLDRQSGKLASAESSTFSLAPGSGPRHLAFHPSGNWAFVINELTSTLTTASWNAKDGKFGEVQTISSVLGELPIGNSTAEVLVHPSGRFVYGSNRGHDSIAVFQFDEQTGKTVLVQNQSTLGKTPRNFRIDPSGRFLLAENQTSGTIRSLRVHPDDGTLLDTGHSISVPSPACIKFVR